MKKISRSSRLKGFTLIELLVAMAVTTFLMLILISLTSVSIDSWRQSRNDVRNAQLSRGALSIMGKDLQSLVQRSGSQTEWLSARVEPNLASGGGLAGPAGKEFSNAAQLVFLCAPTDRYDGAVAANPGDISAVGYRLVYRDSILNADPGGSSSFPTFALFRELVNPTQAFATLYTSTNLIADFESLISPQQQVAPDNFVVENIYEFTITFHVKYTDPTTQLTRTRLIPLSVGDSSGGSTLPREFRLFGDRLSILGNNDAALVNGKVTHVTLSISTLTDEGLQLAKTSNISQADLMARHSEQSSLLIKVPGF